MRRWVDRPTRDLLLLSADDGLREQARQLIGNGVVVSVEGTSAREGLELLSSRAFDCVVLDPVLPDLPGLQLIEDVLGRSTQPIVPFVVYAPPGRLPEAEQQRLARLVASTVVRPASSLEELFDGATFFLHRVATTLPEPQRHILERLHEAYRPLAGRTVLIVDDDVRNIFAMTSLLERHGMHVLSAETGAEALRALEAHPEIGIVLMDIMLPEIDGYDTTRAIRARENWRGLPVVALTAKAMKGDREKCIDAGASDYLAKPVDTTHLLSTLSLWLTQ
jgi:CheY-like chemotaxis protein